MSPVRYAAILIWGTSGLLGVFITITATLGVLLWAQRKMRGEYDPLTLRWHAQTVKASFWTMMAAVTVIEAAVRWFKLPYAPLFWIHIPLFVLLAGFFGWSWKYNGMTSRSRHRFLAPTTWTFGIATIVTGNMIVYQLLWLR